MKQIMATFVLLTVALAAVPACAGSARGAYYNHGAYRGMPYRMTRRSTGIQTRSAKVDRSSQEKVGVVAYKPK